MHRSVPVCNKLIVDRWIDRNRRIHQQNLKNVKSSIDNKTPVRFKHVQLKAKRHQLLEGNSYLEKKTEIQRAIQLGFNMFAKPKRFNSKPHHKDSLNKSIRDQATLKITQENEEILRRLQNQRASYNVTHWERDRAVAERRLKNMCQYPYHLGVTKRSPLHTRRSAKTARSNSFRGKSYNNTPRVPVKYQSTIELERKIVNVEIKSTNEMYLVSAKTQGKIYTLEIPKRDAHQLMGNSKDFNKLINKLRMDGEELFLEDVPEENEYQVYAVNAVAMAEAQPKEEETHPEKSLDKCSSEGSGEQGHKSLSQASERPSTHKSPSGKSSSRQSNKSDSQKSESQKSESEKSRSQKSESQKSENQKSESQKSASQKSEKSASEESEHGSDPKGDKRSEGSET